MNFWTTLYSSEAEWRTALIGASEITFFDYTRAYDKEIRAPHFITFLSQNGQEELAAAVAASPDFLIHDQNFIAAYECYIVYLCTSYLNYVSPPRIAAISNYILYGHPLPTLEQDLITLNALMESLARLSSIIDWSAKQIFDQCFRVYARLKTDPGSVDWDQVGKNQHLFNCAAIATGKIRNLDTDLISQFDWRNKIVTFTLIVANFLDRARGSKKLAHYINILHGRDAPIFQNVIGALFRSGLNGTEMRYADFLEALQQFFNLMQITLQKFRCGQMESDHGNLIQALPYNIPALTARSPAPEPDILQVGPRQTYISREIETEAPYTPLPPGAMSAPLQFQFFSSPQEWGETLDHQNNATTFNYLRAYNANLIKTPAFVNYVNDVADPDRVRIYEAQGGYYTSTSDFIKMLKNYYTALVQKGLDHLIAEEPRLYQALAVLVARESENSLRWIKDYLDPLYQALQHLTLVRDWEQKLIREECMRRYGMVGIAGRSPAPGDPRVYGQCDTRGSGDRIIERDPNWKEGTSHEKLEIGDVKHLAFRNKLAYLCQSIQLLWTFLQSGISSQGPRYGWPQPPGAGRSFNFMWGTISQTVGSIIRILEDVFGGPSAAGTHRNKHPENISPGIVHYMAGQVPNWTLPMTSPPRIKTLQRESSAIAPPAKIQRPNWDASASSSVQHESQPASSSVQAPSSSSQWSRAPSSSTRDWAAQSSTGGLGNIYEFQKGNSLSGVGENRDRGPPIVGRYQLNTRR